MPTKPKPSNQPFTPRGAELGPPPLPTEEEIMAELVADAGDVVCIYQFVEGPSEYSPRISYKILVGKDWVPWQSLDAPVLLEHAVIRVGRNGGRYAAPAYQTGHGRDCDGT